MAERAESPFKSKRAILGYAAMFFGSPLWTWVARLGDIDFLVSSAGRVRPHLMAAWELFRDWGWLLGVGWLTFLWLESMRPVRAVHEPQSLAPRGDVDGNRGGTAKTPAQVSEAIRPPLSDADVSSVIRRAQEQQHIEDVAESVLKGTATADDLLDAASLPVTLKWGKNGAFFKAASHAQTMLMVRFILTDARWLSSDGYWVTTKETHPGGVFRKLQIERLEMHPEQPLQAGSIQNETHRLSIQGTPIEGGRIAYCRPERAGKWRLEFRFEDDKGRSVQHFLCLNWDGKNTVYQAVETCPDGKLP